MKTKQRKEITLNPISQISTLQNPIIRPQNRQSAHLRSCKFSSNQELPNKPRNASKPVATAAVAKWEVEPRFPRSHASPPFPPLPKACKFGFADEAFWRWRIPYQPGRQVPRPRTGNEVPGPKSQAFPLIIKLKTLLSCCQQKPRDNPRCKRK
ncbi:MAG: hypothetical protein JWM04_723 [Verrucomicrobiales bacterium]|nr:hypothetical protein [Verrucomicrobiales bacterium]